MAITVRLGGPANVNAAVSVYERSNLARRGGVWPNQASRLEDVAAILRDPASWFLLAEDGTEAVGMASVQPLRADDGVGAVIPGACFINLVYVVPERWGQGIGGVILSALLNEARLRGTSQARLWTHEQDNQRAQRLYRRHGFFPTGRTMEDDDGALTGEWASGVPHGQD